MEPNAKYIFVGSLLILLVAVFIGLGVWLTGIGREGEERIFVIIFKQQSLAGLQVGSSVTMRGIRVAKVKSIQILEKEAEGVRVAIRMEDETPVRSNHKAVIQRNILTGLATIELQSTESEGEVLEPSTDEDEAPSIPEGIDPLQSLRMSLDEILLNINNSLSRLNTFLAPENKTTLEESLKNIRDITQKVSKELDELKGSGHETVKLLEESRIFLKETGDTLVNLKKQFSEGAVDLSVKGAELTHSIDKTAEAISSTLDKYKNPQNILFGPQESSLGPGEEKLENAR